MAIVQTIWEGVATLAFSPILLAHYHPTIALSGVVAAFALLILGAIRA